MKLPGCVLILLFVLHASPTAAQTPDPLGRVELYAFPGAVTGPASAVSAGTALADRWLGDEAFSNPAAAPGRRLSLSPTLLHPSRQDLRAKFHEFDETSAFIDLAGGSLSLPLRQFSFTLYGMQPVLRHEENAYLRGEAGAFPPPAVVAGQTDSRESRAGLAVSSAWHGLRLGVAGEWVRRDDSYDYEEKNGVIDPGVHHADFSGTGLGFQAGVRGTFGGAAVHRLTAGAAVRYLPALSLDGRQSTDLLSGTSDTTFTVKRAAAWEGGVSARYALTEAFGVLAAAGGRGAQAWDGFGVTSGPVATWSVGGEFHDAGDPWTVRFGIGQELQTGVPEPRAGMIGVGFGWALDRTTLDFSALRRSLARADEPMSYDDRLVASVNVAF
jgi:hypothetical protein